MANQSPRAVVGADLGGNNQTTALVSGSGGVLGRFRQATAAHRIVEVAVTAVVDGFHALVGNAVRAATLGLGVPGLRDANRGTVAEWPNFPIWCAMRVKPTLEARLGTPVHLENDVNAASASPRP